MRVVHRNPSIAAARRSVGRSRTPDDRRRGWPAVRSLRALATAAILGGALLAIPAAAPSPVGGIGPLPPCRIADILTVPRGYDDWSITLVDWILSVGPDYKPPDLVSVRQGGVAGGGLIRKVSIADLRAMAKAAKANGTPIVSWSPYRSYNQQVKLFNGYAKGYGYDDAIHFSGRPGHSEHQLGLTIDFVSVGANGLSSSWEKTRTGAWMAKHAWEYGWLMSYPKGKSDITCYNYEPWHYRYVGRDLAKKIHDSGQTVREYLWANFTMVDPVTGEPVPTPSSSASPEASPTAVPTATASQSSPPQLPAGSLAAASPPTSQAGTWFGVDPPVVASLLVVLTSIGLIASFGFVRRSRRG
jgi:D-alanyl-D-alanine carboxypeptidase